MTTTTNHHKSLSLSLATWFWFLFHTADEPAGEDVVETGALSCMRASVSETCGPPTSVVPSVDESRFDENGRTITSKCSSPSASGDTNSRP